MQSTGKLFVQAELHEIDPVISLVAVYEQMFFSKVCSCVMPHLAACILVVSIFLLHCLSSPFAALQV